MGLIKAAKNAVSSMMADGYKEYFYCTSLSNNVLMVKGQKQSAKGYDSNKGLDNIISNGSVVSINEGQCMLIVDQGKIVDFCAEAGEFVYDSSSEPSLFYGGLSKEFLKQTVDQFVRRTGFAGVPKDQRVYYINTKEIQNNLYGTPNPIAFHFVAKNTGFELETSIKCNGKYSFRIVNPLQFYINVAGNVADSYERNEELMGTMKAELLTVLPTALAKIGAEGILPSALPAHLTEIADYLKEELSPEWTEKRGIEVVSMTMSAPIVPQEDLDRINKWYDTAVLTNSQMAAARQTEAYTQALENMGNGGEDGQASSVNGAMGMMGMAMMQNMMNNGMGSMFGTPGQAQQPQMKPAGTVAEGAVLGWTCGCGKTDNRGKFCSECGGMDLFLRACESGKILPGMRTEETGRGAFVQM